MTNQRLVEEKIHFGCQHIKLVISNNMVGRKINKGGALSNRRTLPTTLWFDKYSEMTLYE